jgi:thiosulfate/3-mercaptopyruvate sulfurtransferase
MPYTILITTHDLAAHLHDPDWLIVDCRFSLDRPDRGREDYLRSHIPGAIYAHLNDDLSGTIVPGVTGRHPLPAIEDMARRFGAWGIDSRTQVVAYDDAGGAMAARLWWLLRWLGHDAVAVLDGGWQQWLAEDRPVKHESPRPMPRLFEPRPHPDLVVDADDVLAMINDSQRRIIDSRAADRYRGENETIDPVAGRIPGALNAPYAENLAADGRFRSPGELAARFRSLLDGDPSEAVFYCGSGVTAAHNLLALAHAGLGDARLYAGSWSGWITDPTRPVERG